MAICSVSSFTWTRLEEKRNTRNLPLRGILDTIIGILWVITVIVCVAILVNRSPVALLTGLGAFAAVLMLVFKDSILGLVAGLQLSQNDMLHVGDWIVVPSTIANGIVTDVSLTAVKVRNWDNTIVTLPPYTLVSGSFQNWRGMSQSGARRIMQNLTIDLTTVRRLTAGEVDAMCAPHPRLKEFVTSLRAAGRTRQDKPGLNPINGTIETNLGLYRAYISLYIYNNPDFSRTQQLLVNVTGTTPQGYILQLYCFTDTTDWDRYEAIQSDLLEHATTALADFGLAMYTSGSLSLDIEKNGSGQQPQTGDHDSSAPEA